MKTKILVLAPLFFAACTTTSINKNKTIKEDNTPKLTKPIVKKIWVPDEIKENGTVYEEGHYRYLLEKESVWSK